MIVDKVNVRSAAIRKAEDDSPIRTHCNGPRALEIAFQGMQPERGQIKRFDCLCGVQYREDLLHLTQMIRIDSFGLSSSNSRRNPLCRKLSIIGAHVYRV
jgi:hypothetical protein